MKKWITIILAIMLLSLSLSALAEGDTQPEESQQQTQTETTGSQSKDSRHQNRQRTKKEQTGETDAVSSATKVPEQQTEESQTSESNAQGTQSKSKAGRGQKVQNDHSSKRFALDTYATQGIISQETADQIRAYVEKKQTDQATEGAVSDSTKPSRQHTRKGKIQLTEDLLKELLDAEIITQAEFDAMLPAQAEPAE